MDALALKTTNMSKHISQPAELDTRFSPAEKKKLAKASQDFESMLTQMMLKSMTKTTGGLFGEEGYGNGVLDSIFEGELANYMSKNNSMGIAEQVYKKITGEEMDFSKMQVADIENKFRDALRIRTSSGLTPSSSAMDRLKEFEKMIAAASEKYGVEKKIIKSIILTESAAKTDAISKAKAKGLMQLMDETAEDMGVKNVFDPAENILGGTKYFSQLMERYDGDMKLSLAAYNAGPSNVDKYKGVPPFTETQNYISRIMGYLKYMDE